MGGRDWERWKEWGGDMALYNLSVQVAISGVQHTLNYGTGVY